MNLGAFIPGLYGYLVIDITGNRWLGHQGGGKVCFHVIDTKRPRASVKLMRIFSAFSVWKRTIRL